MIFFYLMMIGDKYIDAFFFSLKEIHTLIQQGCFNVTKVFYLNEMLL